jgi:4-hydroxybenzoate polyprenyltransferase
MPPKPPHSERTPRIADAPPGNWTDRYAPESARPYLRLARLDRPIGLWLLLLPCWWAVALADLALERPYPSPWLLALFAIGALAMRAAGCAYNDYVDRDYDARIARTASRPIPSGQVAPAEALAFAAICALAGFMVLIQFNAFTIRLGAASLLLVAVYPFLKRYTYWPQIALGLAFNWGALVGWSAVMGSLGLPAILLYCGSVLWTMGYDTIYAHQDKEDDLMLGLKSTAIRFGDDTRTWVGGLYAGAVTLWLLAGTRDPPPLYGDRPVRCRWPGR